ncbi:MAG: PAS domain S-box protein [Paludibacter sp.]|nr:PAS domain S-box protein [Paludibacter sp.]
MSDTILKAIIDSPILGFAHHRIILDNFGKPVDYQFLEVNSFFENLTGLKRENIINRTVKEVIPSIEKESFDWIGFYGDVALKGERKEFEQYSEGLQKWFKVYAYSSEKMYFLTLFLDITERKYIEEKLLRLSQIVEQSPVSVVVSDVKGDIEYVNPKFTDQTGYSLDEVLGENPRILKSGEMPDEEYKTLWATITSGKIWQGEFHNKRKDGTLFWETASISPIVNKKGIITHFLALKEDVTQRKQAEDQLHKFLKVVDQSPNMIIITGLDAVIEYVNQSFCRISGYSSEDVIGKRYKLLKLAQADESEYEDLWNCLRAGVAWHGENIDKRKNGELYWQGVSINPILSEAGNTTNYVSILSDISDRRKMEDELQELNMNLEQKVHDRTSELLITNEFLMNEVVARKKNEAELKTARVEAEKANKAKSEFISRMSHELRTPMNSILGFAQLFAMGELTPGQRKGVDHILNSGNHLLKLINEVLDISKIEAGKLSLSLEFIKVREVIIEAIDFIKPLTIKPEIKIHYENSDHDQLTIKADKQRLIQVLVNLLNNAVKFNRQGGSITIKTFLLKKNDNAGDKVQISITDTGVGISEKNFTKLFKPFERFGSTEQTTEGSGLGLSISKELMTLMGGTIGASSKPDKGSTFWVELPFAKNQTNSYSNLYAFQKNNAEQNKGNATILYIEDNDSNIELIEQVFNIHRPNSRLISHKYGNDTVQLAIDNMPNIILLDLDLPDMHGSQVMELLKKNDKTKHIPVIIISADAMPYRIKKLMKAGAKNYLTKPFDVLELLTEIDKFKITYD